MWQNTVQNLGALKAIYKEKLPSLNKVTLQEFSVLTGDELNVILRIDSHEMPSKFPEKWMKQEVNTLQFTLGFLEVSIKDIAVKKSNFKNIKLSIESVDNKYLIEATEGHGKKVFSFFANWIYLKSVSGYFNELNSSVALPKAELCDATAAE